MEKELKIKCPCCESILFVDRITGKIIETRKPLIEESSGDRLTDAFTKTRQDKEKRAALFDDMAGNLEKKKKLSEELFKSSLEDAKKDENEKPHSIFDAD
ncbi:hypothetical protein MNBD_NITROSPINAE03-1599 [hydrothermal vent metagenome]|uniref:2-nitropropane dioxygenase n=1 Tax=hydrothermal vent metagenome TaxID=652676 RepID=A0A3B1CGL4_9ZZZZ